MLIAACLAATLAPGLAVAQAPAKPGVGLPAGVMNAPFTGDLDEMVKRRVVRALVPFSKTFFTVDRGLQRGLAVDIGKMFEDHLNKKLNTKHLRVHVVFITANRDEMIPMLLAGKADVALGNYTITPERSAQIAFTATTRRNVSEIVVTGPGAPPIATVQDLAGKEVYVRKSSSYFASLEKLNEQLKKDGKPPVNIRIAPEDLETEDILEMVNAGLVKITVADNYLADFWKLVLPKLQPQPGAAVREGAEIAGMLRKDNPQLKAAFDELIALYPEGSSRRNQLLTKYYKNTKYVKESTSQEEIAKFERTIAFFRTYSGRYEVDYLLMMAQGYQESRLDQNAKSPVGAIGVMQVMPATGADMKVGDINQIEPNIHAGVKYMRFMMENFYKDAPMTPLNKGLFTFASYNAGPGRMNQLRREAEKRGLDPNVWFNSVERLAAEKIGRETVTYVSNIYKYYLAYKMIEEERIELEAAKKKAAGG